MLALLAACAGPPGPAPADAKAALHLLEAAAEVSDPDVALRMQYAGCSEIPGCAAGCAEGLRFGASPDASEAQRGAVLGDCFPAARTAASADAWFRGHLDAFLDAARPVLDAAEQQRFDAARPRVPRS